MRSRSVAGVLAALALLAACSSDEPSAVDDAPPASASSTPDTAAPDTAAPESAPDTEPAETTIPDTDPVPTELDGEPPACSTVPVGLTETTLEAGGAVHDVRIQVPTTYIGDGLLPVVLNWHGLGSNGTEQAIYTGYEALAEQEGFIAVHPTGAPAPGVGANSWELAVFEDPSRDDVAFAEALIDELVGRWCGDPTRIYSTGMSNGGFFTARLVCEIPERIAAAVSVAGLTHPDDCDPSRAVPYRAYHGTADEVVSFDGSGSVLLDAFPGGVADAFFSQVMPDEFAEFAADAGCATEPEVTAVGDDVTRYDYVGCVDDVPLTFFEIADGGHTWPDTPLAAANPEQFGTGTTTTVDATVDAWEFFEQHRLD